MDVALMAAAAGLGFANGPIWSVLVLAVLLTATSYAKHLTLARRYADVGSVRVAALSIGASAINNAVFAAMAFMAGRAFAWLVWQ
jgi:hypothetical protein